METSDKNQQVVAGAATDDAGAAKDDSPEKPPPYLKLIADCWEHIFDYLSFKDIIQMGQTCKRMNQMAGYYVREYYPQLDFELIGNEICCKGVCLQSDFYRFISRLRISCNRDLEFFSNVATFDALKKIIFFNVKLNRSQIVGMQNVLKNVEVIQLSSCNIASDAYEQIANHCQKLKQLRSHNCEINNALFSQCYPAMERLRFVELKGGQMLELKPFLVKHMNLKQFQADSYILWLNQDVLMNTNIQLNLLKVRYRNSDHTAPFEQFFDFLRALHERGFYKVLEFYVGDSNHEYLRDAISSLPALEKLSLIKFPVSDWNRLNNLKELSIIYMTGHEINAETLAKGLPKLEKLSLARIDTSSAILPFIRHSKRLKTIEIRVTTDDVLDLYALNQERKKLDGACQVCIYIRDLNYLATKWKSHNFNLELDLVRIMRLDGFNFYEYF